MARNQNFDRNFSGILNLSDVHHFFAETMSKSKKNDHAMHNTSLDALIKHYIPIFESMGTPLEVTIIWSDNAPYHYRCCQNFMKIATVEKRFPGIKFIHRLAVVDQFKGNHDAVGKDPARLIRSMELSGLRSENARMVFKNCHRLEKRGEDSEWLELERRKDIRLKRKGKYGMDSQTVWFFVETEDDFNALARSCFVIELSFLILRAKAPCLKVQNCMRFDL
jgi:hypothetical protein